MKKPVITLKTIIMHELDCGGQAFDYNRDIATAAIIVDRTFSRPTYTTRTANWSKEDKTRYAKAVQEVLKSL